MATVSTTDVIVTATKKGSWDTGFDGEFIIENKNKYDV